MSIATELEALATNLGAAKSAVTAKGGTVGDTGLAGLATEIAGIPSGSTPTPLDPQVVYQQTRPADWLPMPTPVDNEIYLLVKVPVPNQEKDPGIPLGFLCQTSAGQYQVELGTVTNGEFVADSTYTELVNSDTKYINYLYYSDWATNPMDDGTHQVMAKISSVSGNITSFDHVQYFQGGIWGSRYTLEARGHCESASKYNFGTSSSGGRSAISMRFCSLDSTNSITNFSSMFENCNSLDAVPALDTSSGTNFSHMFGGCYSLAAIPVLDVSSGTNFSHMFNSCSSLAAIPQLNTSLGTNFSYMFNNCFSLTAIPQLNTSSGTDFSNMLSSCRALTTIPALDTSSGTSFSYMFSQCSSLTAIPQLNTSSGTSFNSMFNSCSSLTAIPQLNTSSGTTFSYMFSSCSSLTAIPQLDTSSGTNFSYMFQNCSSLTTIPALNTSSGINFSNMFQNCYSLAAIPQLNTSSGTNFSYMFYQCYSLTAIPQLDTSSGTDFNNMFFHCNSLSVVPALDTSSGTNFSQMFQDCTSLAAVPALDTSSGTNFYYMFNSCSSLRYIDFVGYDFTSITNANNRPTYTYANGGGIMRIDNKFQMSTGGFTGAVMDTPQGASSTNPFYILVEDEQTMIPLGANATTVFTSYAYAYVVVPDSIYATYAADTYWATLGTRLKKRSEVTLPAWY